jgi:hypothetical protein
MTIGAFGLGTTPLAATARVIVPSIGKKLPPVASIGKAPIGPQAARAGGSLAVRALLGPTVAQAAKAPKVSGDPCGEPRPDFFQASGLRNRSAPGAIEYFRCRDALPVSPSQYGPGIAPSSPITVEAEIVRETVPSFAPPSGGLVLPTVGAGPNANGFGNASRDLSRYMPEDAGSEALALTRSAGPGAAVASSFGGSVEAPDWAWIAGGVAMLALVGWHLHKKGVF